MLMRTFADLTFAEHAARGIGFGPGDRKPSIQANHIDGPLLHFSDGQLHWLTVWERFLLKIGLTDAEKLQRKLRPRLSAEIERIEWFCT
jgi:hypothetical protein